MPIINGAYVSGNNITSATQSAMGNSGGGNVGGGLMKVGTGLATGNYLQAGLGLVQTIGGISGAKKIQEQPFPEFAPINELVQGKTRSSMFSNMGYTPEQRAQFFSTMGMSQNADYKNAVNMGGGGLSAATNASRGGMRTRAINDFAAGDAKQRMDNIRYDDSMTDKLQRINGQQTQSAIARRMALDQAYGGAIKTGTENLVNAFPGGNAGSYNLGSAFGMLSKMTA